MKNLSKFCIAALFFSLSNAQNLPTISVSIEPLKFFVDNVSSKEFDVNVLVGKNQDPHTYEPKPANMRKLANSVAYFSIDAEFDNIWQKRFSSNAKDVKFYDLSKGIKKENFTRNDHADHADHTNHSHASLDPHIWLDPILVSDISRNIALALCEINKKNCPKYEQNLAEFLAQINEIDTYAKAKFKALKGEKFLVYHPSFGYFANRYGLEQIAVEVDGSEPKPANLAKLIKMIKDENIKVMFTSPQFSVRTSEILAKQTGIKLAYIDFLGYEWNEWMKRLIDEIYESTNQK